MSDSYKQYQKFQASQCDAESDSEFEKIGMGELSGKIRYLAIGGVLSITRGDVAGEHILDLGAGYGTMWKYYADHDLCSLPRTLTVVDQDPKAVEALCNLQYELNETEVIVGNGDFIEAVQTTDCTCIVSCGALDYYGIGYISKLLDAIRDSGKMAVLEVNIQSPETAAHPGTHHLSIGTWYDLMYEKFLADGESSVNFEMIKKYTAIITIDPVGTKELAELV